MVLTFFLTFGDFLANFERLVLGCIETNLCKLIVVGKLLTRSTRFTNFRSAPHSKIQLNFVKYFRIFTISLKFHSFFAIFVQISPIITKLFRNFTKFAGKDQNLLDSQISDLKLLNFSKNDRRKVRKS